ncbi:MAG TPA: penicillin-binding transpeptidase domain-containing protein [Desulfobacteria bacterium]|nr:penicillin-binding transpeptidase domain-containing protein [Desulfobacteria bacterium]
MEEQERKYLKKRLIFLVIAIFLAFSLIISRLWNLQIALGSQFAAKAKGNVLRYVSIPSSRGDILDKNGKLLATSVPQFAITLDWLDMQNSKAYDPKAVIKALANYVQPYWQGGHVSVNTITEDILATIQLNQFNRYEPVVVMQNIPADLQAVMAEHQQELPGITVEARPYRVYPEQYAPIFGNILGYVREVSESELPGFQAKAQALGLSKTYQQGDFVGKMGVENSYDAYLRGKDGVQLMEVDNKAQPVNRLTSQDPVIGDSLKLTIDADLQQAVSNSMDKVMGDLKSQGTSNVGAGAAVVIDVKTGKILAMVSKPNMDPNPLIGNISDATFNEYFGTRDQGPRLGWSRAFQEIYAPGSTFKMITGMAALQDGKVTPGEPINDSFSSLEHPEAGIADYYAYSKGAVNLDKGLADSINLYFEALGQRVMDSNPERLRQVALQFGLGQKTGIDLPGEIAGVAPSAAWKKRIRGDLVEKRLG